MWRLSLYVFQYCAPCVTDRPPVGVEVTFISRNGKVAYPEDDGHKMVTRTCQVPSQLWMWPNSRILYPVTGSSSNWCVFLWTSDWWIFLWTSDWWIFLSTSDWWVIFWTSDWWIFLWTSDWWIFLWTSDWWVYLWTSDWWLFLWTSDWWYFFGLVTDEYFTAGQASILCENKFVNCREQLKLQLEIAHVAGIRSKLWIPHSCLLETGGGGVVFSQFVRETYIRLKGRCTR